MTSKNLEQARENYRETHNRYVNSSWKMGPVWRQRLIEATRKLKELEALEDAL